MSSSHPFITWRVYRDRDQAPVPVIRAGGNQRQETGSAHHAHLHYKVHGPDSPDGRVFVGPYDKAEGLYTKTVWNDSPHLPASSLRQEPILLTTQQNQPGYGDLPYGSPQESPDSVVLGYGSPVQDNRRSLAVPLWEPPNASRDIATHARGYYDGQYGLLGQRGLSQARRDFDPHVRMQNGRPVLFTPQTIHERLYGGMMVLQADGVGPGVFQIPAGFPGPPAAVRFKNDTFGKNGEVIDYDPYHGTVYLEYPSGDPVDAAARVEVQIDTSRSMALPLGDLDAGTYPIVQTPSKEIKLGNYAGPTIATLVVDHPPDYYDTRRLAPAHDSDSPAAVNRHRVGQAHYDAGPVSSRHCWIVETDAPPERVREAVNRSMPAGTLYRQIPMYGPATAVDSD